MPLVVSYRRAAILRSITSSSSSSRRSTRPRPFFQSNSRHSRADMSTCSNVSPFNLTKKVQGRVPPGCKLL